MAARSRGCKRGRTGRRGSSACGRWRVAAARDSPDPWAQPSHMRHARSASSAGAARNVALSRPRTSRRRSRPGGESSPSPPSSAGAPTVISRFVSGSPPSRATTLDPAPRARGHKISRAWARALSIVPLGQTIRNPRRSRRAPRGRPSSRQPTSRELGSKTRIDLRQNILSCASLESHRSAAGRCRSRLGHPRRAQRFHQAFAAAFPPSGQAPLIASARKHFETLESIRCAAFLVGPRFFRRIARWFAGWEDVCGAACRERWRREVSCKSTSRSASACSLLRRPAPTASSASPVCVYSILELQDRTVCRTRIRCARLVAAAHASKHPSLSRWRLFATFPPTASHRRAGLRPRSGERSVQAWTLAVCRPLKSIDTLVPSRLCVRRLSDT